MESKDHNWKGDVDFGDGELQEQHRVYLKHLKLIDGLCQNLSDVDGRQHTCQDLKEVQTCLKNDRIFIDEGINCYTCTLT